MKASEYLQFHPEGDVVLILRDKAHDGEEDFGSSSLCSHPSDTDDVCGHQQSREVHMCVSSMHLVQVSPVFRGLLRGGFKESHRLRSEGAIEIPLPGDDPSTFEILLNIIHGRLKRVPSRINIDQLTQVAILVDKYGLHEVSQWYTAAWIDCLKGSLPMSFTKELMPWICISWVFQEQVYIEKTTEIALWESEGDLCNTTEFSLPIPAFVLGNIALHFIISL